MNNKKQYVAAIDIGTTKIVTIIGERNENGKLEIVAHSKTESTGVKRGLVLNIEETVNAIYRTVEEAQNRSGFKLNEVFVGIAGQHIRSIRNRGYRSIQSPDNEIRKEDIEVLMKDMFNIPIEAGEEILHVIPQNYIVDMEAGILNPVGMVGRRLEGNYHIVIGNMNSAKNIEKCINRVNLNLKKLILEPLASAVAVLTEEEKEAGVAMVDIGGGTTDLTVYYEGIVCHTAVIPFGGNVITKDIKEGLAVMPKQAEELKLKCGTCLPEAADDECVISIQGQNGRGVKEISFRNLAGIIGARMEEIIDAVAFEIESSGIMDKLSAGIVITGGGALLRDLPQLVKFKTGMDVRVGYPCESLAANTESIVNHPMYATAIGLVLKGFEYYDETGTKPQPAKATVKEEPVIDQEEVIGEAEEVEETNQKKGFGLFDNFKKLQTRVFDMFDETTDSTM